MFLLPHHTLKEEHHVSSSWSFWCNYKYFMYGGWKERERVEEAWRSDHSIFLHTSFSSETLVHLKKEN